MSLDPKTRFLWLDVETTGLSPTNDLLLEVAAWPTRSADPLDLHAEDARSYVIAQSSSALGASLSPVTWRMHGANGLLGEVTDGRVARHDKQAMLEFARQVTRDDLKLNDAWVSEHVWHLAGNSVHFDLGFLREKMGEFARLLSHRVLDVSSLLLTARSLGMPKLSSAPAHRAMDDVVSSVRQYVEVLEFMRSHSPSFETSFAQTDRVYRALHGLAAARNAKA